MVYMTKMGKNLTKIPEYIYLNLKERCSLSWLKETPPVLQRALQTRSFFVFVLFFGTVLACLDADLDLQTPLNLDSF
jgi:hypothetical protein